MFYLRLKIAKKVVGVCRGGFAACVHHGKVEFLVGFKTLKASLNRSKNLISTGKAEWTNIVGSIESVQQNYDQFV